MSHDNKGGILYIPIAIPDNVADFNLKSLSPDKLHAKLLKVLPDKLCAPLTLLFSNS